MQKQITLDLNSTDIKQAIAELEKYRERLIKCTHEFVDLLANVGVHAAQGVASDYTPYILFEREIKGEEGIFYVASLVARDQQKIVRSWRYKGGWKTAEVSPLLMAEFGSGWFADVQWESLQGSDKVGQGTFPNQKHAFDLDKWHWTDENNKTHYSHGERPSYPMYQAWVEMMQAVDRIGKLVFT